MMPHHRQQQQQKHHVYNEDGSSLFDSPVPWFRELHTEIGLIGGELDGADHNKTTEDWKYHPHSLVLNMHKAPRFGHSNNIGKLASKFSRDKLDYANGIKQFLMFLIVPFMLWGIILLAFKYVYGIEKVGCAAGGEAIDLVKLSEQGMKRKRRKIRIFRNWKVQTAFLFAAVLIPVVSAVLVKIGLRQLEQAWSEVRDINDDIESLSFRGLNVVTSLEQGRKQLLVTLPSLFPPVSISESTMPVPSWCPNLASQRQESNPSAPITQIDAIMNNIGFQVGGIAENLDKQVALNPSGMVMLTEATAFLDNSIDWGYNHDWLLKFFLMILNVVNLFFIFVCRVLSKNNIVHEPTRHFISFLMLPLFIGLAVFHLFAMATSGVATLVNADFCAGGPGEGSPQGAIEDAMLYHRYGSSNRELGKDLLVYEAFRYFATGCLTDNPLGYLGKFQMQIDEAIEQVHLLRTSIQANNEQALLALSETCGTDLSIIEKNLENVDKNLTIVASNFNELMELSSCHVISPIIRRITHGAFCQESVNGITTIWASLFVISILSFVMLTTRAAVFNSIITRKQKNAKRRKLRPEKVEKEFEEYKVFMSDFYDDTDNWIMRPVKKQVGGFIEIDLDSDIKADPTWETEATKTLSGDSEEVHDGITDNDSDYTDDSSESEEEDDDDDGDDGLSSFISETASLAKQTIDALRSLPSMLGSLAGRNKGSLDIPSILGGDFSPKSSSSHNESFDFDDADRYTSDRDEFEPLYRTPQKLRESPQRLAQYQPIVPSQRSNLSESPREHSSEPAAPRKTVNALGRTKKDESTLYQGQSGLAEADSDFRPRQLNLSPAFLAQAGATNLRARTARRTPVAEQRAPSPTTPPVQARMRRGVRTSFSDGASPPESLTKSTEIPEKPKKVYRRINRSGAPE